jgi:hypothetical protein
MSLAATLYYKTLNTKWKRHTNWRAGHDPYFREATFILITGLMFWKETRLHESCVLCDRDKEIKHSRYSSTLT